MSDIARKILAIIAKAESTESKDEGTAFLAKAHQLMRDNNLSMLDLGNLEDDAIGGDMDAGTWYGGYHGLILSQLGFYYGCKIITRQVVGKSTWSIFGRESARVTTCLMLPYVLREVRRQAIAAHKLGEYSSVSVGITRIGNALALRISKMRDLSENHAVEIRNALVPVDRIELAVSKAFPSLREGKKKSVHYDSNASHRANNINISLQTGPASEKRMIM